MKITSPINKEYIKETYNVTKLLSDGGTNAKTSKNSIKSFILYLAPYNQNSKNINICPKASKGCAAACLFSAGRGKFNSVIEARTNKTEFYLKDKELFIQLLAKEILTKYKTAKKTGSKVAFRLNGTSDLDFVYLLKKYAYLDIEDLQDVAVFYDYTKIIGKAIKYLSHPNYVVTFSKSEINNVEFTKALELGINTAAVFSNELPETYKGIKVVDGDKSDITMLDYTGVILGLKAKGDAKKDNTGFVITEY
jgi:hypothetical protein